MEQEKEEDVEEPVEPTPVESLSYPTITEEGLPHNNMPYLPPLFDDRKPRENNGQGRNFER